MSSRRSSKTEKQSTSDRADEAAHDEPSRRSSKVSILKGRRDRSRASSRRSRQTQDVANAEKSNETTTPTIPDMNGPPKPQQKRISKLRSLLCCASSSNVDGDESALPSKKTTTLPAASNRVPTPDKAEAQTGDSSTVESRDLPYIKDEKTHPIVSADQSQPKEEDHVARSDVDVQGEGTSATAGQSETAPKAAPTDLEEQENIASTSNGVIPEEKTNGVEPQSEPAAGVEPFPLDESTDKKVSSAEDEDVHEEDAQSVTVLPPPPPLPVPEPPIAPDAGEQQWLLPPAVPHLKNRKCLVLDLDETLVHSSFKVRKLPVKKADFA